jgi:hypothetical protein
MRDFGLKNCVLPHAIRALDLETRVAGCVFTMLGRPDPTSTVHDSVIRWTEFLSAAPKRHVIVCQPQAEAVIGEVEKVMNTENLVRKAILGGAPPREAYLQ